MAKLRPIYRFEMTLEEVLRHNTLEERDTAMDLALNEYTQYVCPMCGTYVADASGNYAEATKTQIDMTRFCSHCGQRLSRRAIDTRDCIPFEEME